MMPLANRKTSSPVDSIALLLLPDWLSEWTAIEPGRDKNDLTALSGLVTDDNKGDEGAELGIFEVDDLRGIFDRLVITLREEGVFFSCDCFLCGSMFL